MHPSQNGVTTPLGPAESVWATSSTHIGMSGTFTINSVAIRTRLDLHLVDGVWDRGYVREGETERDNMSKWNSLLLNRVDDFGPPSYKKKDVSSSARAKIEAALVPWLAEYATGDGAALVLEAGQAKHAADIAAAERKIADLQAEIVAAEAALEQLR